MKKTSFLYALLVLFFISYSQAEENAAQTIPSFQLETLEGEQFEFNPQQENSQVFYVVNFWASWCMPCMVEMKQLKKQYSKYHKQGIQFLSISIDEANARSKVRTMVQRKKYPFTILLDPDKTVHNQFAVMSIPHIFIMDAQGHILYSHSGYQKGDEEELFQKMDQLLTPQ